MNGFNPIDGGYSDIVSVNDDSLGSVESSKFVLNIDSSIYANEVYTINYINGLFASLQKICENCQSVVNSAKSYLIRNNEIAEIPLPEIVDFDFSITSSSTVATANDLTTEEYQTGAVNIRSGTLNMRSAPNGTIIAGLTNATHLKIIGQAGNNSEWYKVQTEDGQEGYVHSNYVALSSPTSTTTTQTINSNSGDISVESVSLASPKSTTPEESINSVGTVDITSGTLNVRATPNGNIISSLNKGDSVTILGTSDTDSDWLKILTSDNQEAYVYSKYIDRG